MSTPDIRCTDCGAEFVQHELATRGEMECPSCGTASVPCAIAEDIDIRINWHELRILTIWATNWADDRCDDQSRRTLQSILRRLDKFRPEGCAALTIVAEVKELQEHYPGASLHRGEDCIVPPKEDDQ